MTADFFQEEEAYLFNCGQLFHSYLRFGAHVLPEGVHFAVWAPHAQRVRVVGTFNDWNGTEYEMKRLAAGATGVWTLFVPGIGAQELYKYQILGVDHQTYWKADPFAFYSEKRPGTASEIYNLEGYAWSESSRHQPTKRRDRTSEAAPMLIYEAHFGSWKRQADGSFYTYRQLAQELIPYLKEMGYTHLEVLPLMEHPLDDSWGYQITGYYAAGSRYGEPRDLMFLIDTCHQAGIGVILDWVPGHFCRDSHGLGNFDGRALFEGGDHTDWGTYRFNFSRAEVWSFLISNALFWFDIYHIDGLRVDGVTSMLYQDYSQAQGYRRGQTDPEAIKFLQTLNETVAAYYPDALMIAEESSDWPRVTAPVREGGLGFSHKWNMGWMNDTLRYMEMPFAERTGQHNLLTFSLLYAFSETFILPFSHDEVVHGKKSLIGRQPGDYWQQFAGLRALYCYFLTHPGKKLCFMGGELAQFIEWRFQEGLEWFLLDYDMHRAFQSFVREANHLYIDQAPLWAQDGDWQGFEWLDADNSAQSVLCFIRSEAQSKEHLLVVINLTPAFYPAFRVGVPGKSYEQILNSDEIRFGGSGQGNKGRIPVQEIPWHDRPRSIEIALPPLAGLILKPVEPF